ncbi:MAG: NAD-dependent epimerase/dehydratase family protein [Acidobacteria bacterium]|nr:NAD-dependent epimerase/dehydratase family protein [Acidobacteriota bacterium]
MNKLRKTVVLGAGGFIGGHLAGRLKAEGCWVRGVDLKYNEYHQHADEFVLGDLTDPAIAGSVIPEGADEVYQLAADMGGALYLFTGRNDANVLHNSALINLNVARACVTRKVKRLFFSSSACVYPAYNQLDPLNPACSEAMTYPAEPDSEYGWEKLFSERLYLAFHRNHGLDVRIARFHNIFGPCGAWTGGREKVPAALCRKVAQAPDGGEIEVWGDGLQTRSFLYIDECLEALSRFMRREGFVGPVNIGSEERVTINQLARMVIEVSGKDIRVRNLCGDDFVAKYGFPCPQGVRGRNSDNALFREKMGWAPTKSLREGIAETYAWVNGLC